MMKARSAVSHAAAQELIPMLSCDYQSRFSDESLNRPAVARNFSPFFEALHGDEINRRCKV